MALYDRLRNVPTLIEGKPVGEPQPISAGRIDLPQDIVFNIPSTSTEGIDSLSPTIFGIGAPPPLTDEQTQNIIESIQTQPVLDTSIFADTQIPQTIDLGGGLGSIALPNVPVDTIVNIANQAVQDFVPYTGDAFDDYLRDVEAREEAPIFEGEDSFSREEAPEMPAPPRDEKVIGQPVEPPTDIEAPELPSIVPDEPVAPAPAPTPAPAPAPYEDFPEGIFGAPKEADEFDLITPDTDRTFTQEEIDAIINPPRTPIDMSDMDRLLQQQRETFGGFLTAGTPSPDAGRDYGTYDPNATSGYIGDTYQSGSGGYYGNQATPYAAGAPGYDPDAKTGASAVQDYSQTYYAPPPIVFDKYAPRLMARGPMDYEKGQQYQNRPKYGGIDFPTMFSGIGSVVPQDAVMDLMRQIDEDLRRQGATNQFRVLPY
jgi:hypothetical protein